MSIETSDLRGKDVSENAGAPYVRFSISGQLRRYALVAAGVGALWALNSTAFSSLNSRNDFNVYLSYALLALGFYWIYGLSGQFSFAHSGFAAVGAYLSAWIARQGVPLVASVVVATVLTAACGGVLLIVLRRASGFYFAIATLGLGSLIIFILRNWNSFTGGVDGQTSDVPVLSVAGRPLTSDEISVVLLGVLSVAFVLAVLIDRSPLRRDATALKYRPDVAQVCGVPSLATRLSLFVTGCAFAALAGALQGHSNGFLATESFGNDLSVGIFLMIVVGGETFLLGPLVGAAFYVFFPRILEDVGLGGWINLVYGCALLAFMIFVPTGILGGLDRLRDVLFKSIAGAPSRLWRSKPPPSPEARPAATAPTFGSNRDPNGLSDQECRLTVRDLRVSFGGVHAVDGINLDLGRREILGLIGPNGSGKSTTLNALTGLVAAKGEVRIDGRACKLSSPGSTRGRGVIRAFQTPQIYPELSCLDNVSVADSDRRGTGIVTALLRPLFVHRHEQRRAIRAREALRTLEVERLVDRPTKALSYGEQRWVELSRSIVADAQIVLLDEPSAGLNDEETGRLGDVVHLLRNRGASVVVVDHKVDFISSVCDRVIVLDFGRVIAEGTPHEVFTNPLVVEAYVGSALAAPAEGRTTEVDLSGPNSLAADC